MQDCHFLGAMIPVMAGVTLAGRMQGKDMVGMVHIGDGGSSTGAFAEGLNGGLLLLGTFEAGDQFDLDRPVGETVTEILEMLLRQ